MNSMPGLKPRIVRDSARPPHLNPLTGEVLENRQQVCPACFENFASTEAGDIHRRRDMDEDPYCANPEEVGLFVKVNRFGTEVWTHR